MSPCHLGRLTTLWYFFGEICPRHILCYILNGGKFSSFYFICERAVYPPWKQPPSLPRSISYQVLPPGVEARLVLSIPIASLGLNPGREKTGGTDNLTFPFWCFSLFRSMQLGSQNWQRDSVQPGVTHQLCCVPRPAGRSPQPCHCW